MADIDDLLAAVAAGPQGPDVGAFFDRLCFGICVGYWATFKQIQAREKPDSAM